MIFCFSRSFVSERKKYFKQIAVNFILDYEHITHIEQAVIVGGFNIFDTN